MRSRQGQVVAVAVGFVVVVAAVFAGASYLTRTSRHGSSSACQATVGSTSFALDVEQARNASTIAAVGKRLGLPDHAVTIALAAALQESVLHNLPYGDRDSVGLFQQRPSQGWGTRAQIMDPTYAATAFYGGLRKLSGWQTREVTVAAQAVQHSATPSAYAKWEPEARVIAEVLTGESAAGLACRLTAPAGPLRRSELDRAMAQELGAPNTGASVDPARGWTVATWLVGQAHEYQISSVSFAGRTWTPGRGSWQADPAAPVGRVRVG